MVKVRVVSASVGPGNLIGDAGGLLDSEFSCLCHLIFSCTALKRLYHTGICVLIGLIDLNWSYTFLATLQYLNSMSLSNPPHQ